MTIKDNNEIRNLFVNKKYKEIINISSIEVILMMQYQ